MAVMAMIAKMSVLAKTTKMATITVITRMAMLMLMMMVIITAAKMANPKRTHARSPELSSVPIRAFVR
eukprot:1312814-Alexandrium_andersonii.AAC.1